MEVSKLRHIHCLGCMWTLPAGILTLTRWHHTAEAGSWNKDELLLGFSSVATSQAKHFSALGGASLYIEYSDTAMPLSPGLVLSPPEGSQSVRLMFWLWVITCGPSSWLNPSPKPTPLPATRTRWSWSRVARAVLNAPSDCAHLKHLS